MELASVVRRLEPERVWRWSRFLLLMLFASFLAMIIGSIWLSPMAQLAICALLLSGIVVGIFVRDELALLSAILLGFILVVRYEAGFQVEEVIYGLAYLSYLGHWFVTRLFFYRDRILRTPVDWALALFLVWVTLSLCLTPLLSGDMTDAVSEWLSISMLAFYFPIKEACIRHRSRRPQRHVLLSMGALALFIALRNFNDYRIAFTNADYLWQIASGRVVMNEHVLMMAAVTALVFFLYAQRKSTRGGFALLFLIFTAGVIIGQSRANWLSLMLGIGIVFLFVERRKKIALAIIGLIGLLGVLAIGAILFDDFFRIIIAGLVDRFASLRTATTEDVSLVNRFVEMEAAWGYIKENPIVGHGFGVPIRYYSLVFDATRVSSFIHNGYVGVLYRHGLIGFVLLMFFYFGAIWNAFRVVYSRSVDQLDWIVAIAVTACLVAESLLANSVNPFSVSDITLIIATMAALGAASWDHEQQNRRATGSP